MKNFYVLPCSLLFSLVLSKNLNFLALEHKIVISILISLINLRILKKICYIIFCFKHDMFTSLTNIAIIIHYSCVIFCQFFSPEELRIILQFIFKNIIFQDVEKSYMEECNSFSSFKDKLDVFVIAHLLGWFIKGFAMRNFFYLFLNSILFELCELKFQHILPNFYECWWDHVLLDILGCNLLGILLSLGVMKCLNMTFFTWTIPNKAKLKTEHLILPKLDKICRRIFKNSSSLILLIFYSIIVNVVDLNIFFLKAELKIPTTHTLVFLRTLFISFMAVKASNELNNIITKGINPEYVSYVYSIISIITLEVILCVKWFPALNSDHSDATVINTVWLFITSVALSIFALLYTNENIL